MPDPSQIALPLGPSDEAPDSILVGNANAHVVEALREPSRWPYNTAVLTGPPASGKSLMGRWFAAHQAGEAIDEADAMDETQLFHRWNRAQENGTALLFIANRSPWTIALPDLASRLGSALQLEIGVPDDDMVADLLASHARRRGLELGESAHAYLVPRMERSFAGIAQIAATIDRLSLERKSAPTMSIWRDALEAVQGPEQARLL